MYFMCIHFSGTVLQAIILTYSQNCIAAVRTSLYLNFCDLLKENIKFATDIYVALFFFF